MYSLVDDNNRYMHKSDKSKPFENKYLMLFFCFDLQMREMLNNQVSDYIKRT